MNRIKLICILIICIILSGCKEYGEKRIVKLVTFNNETVALYYYDYSKDKTSYLKEEMKNNGIENTLTELLSEHDYDLKLCKYAVCDKAVVHNEADVLYNALMNAKFSPDIVILEGDTEKDCERYTKLKQKNYPVYSYKAEKALSGIVEKADSNEKNVIVNSEIYKVLNTEQSFVFDIMKNILKKGTYVFEHDGRKLAAELSGISVFYYADNTELTVNISAALKSYKGMAANEKEKKKITEFLKNSIADNAKTLLDDRQITEKFNLLWYRKVEKFDTVTINVNII